MGFLDEFDLEGYLEAAGYRPSTGKVPQMVGPCPFEDCKSADRCYVNLEEWEDEHGTHERGAWICFRCGRKGSGFAPLYAEHEGLEPHEAKAALVIEVRGGAGFGSAVRTRDKNRTPHRPVSAPQGPIEWRANTHLGALAILAKERIPGLEPIYDSSRDPVWRFPKYLQERGVTREQARRYEIGFCNSGRYSGRIIFPVVCPEGLSFTARAVSKAAEIRYLSGPGTGKLVFGWFQAASRIAAGKRALVIAEGVFDVLAYDRAGFASVALLGKGLGPLRTIRMLGGTRLVLSLDPEAHDEAIEQIIRAGIDACITDDLEGYGDPGEAPPDVLRRAVQGARPLESALRAAVTRRLRGLL